MLRRALGVLLFLGLLGLMTPGYGRAETPETYVVQPGDTVYQIARRFDVAASAIIELNQLLNPQLIFPGQVLRIPNEKGGAPPPVSPPQAPLTLPADGSWISVPFKVTAYCMLGNMSGGKPVYEGAAAADASLFPFGTLVDIEGIGVFTIEDRFAWDAREHRLDIWKSTCTAAQAWGVQFHRVRILSIGAGAPVTAPGAAAETEALRFIAARRNDIIAFYSNYGWSANDPEAMVKDWLRMTDESLVVQAGRQALTVATSMGMGFDEGAALDYIASRRPDVPVFYIRYGWPADRIRDMVSDWLMMSDEPMFQRTGRQATAVALMLGWDGR